MSKWEEKIRVRNDVYKSVRFILAYKPYAKGKLILWVGKSVDWDAMKLLEVCHGTEPEKIIQNLSK